MLSATLSGSPTLTRPSPRAALATSGQLSLEAASIPILLVVQLQRAEQECLVAWVSGGRTFAAYMRSPGRKCC